MYFLKREGKGEEKAGMDLAKLGTEIKGLKNVN